jgi:hypothetical protein
MKYAALTGPNNCVNDSPWVVTHGYSRSVPSGHHLCATDQQIRKVETVKPSLPTSAQAWN